jgi:hypothetical protein
VDKQTENNKPNRKDFAFGISLSEFMISMAAGLGSGVAASLKTIRDYFHEDVKDAPAFKHHFDERADRLDKIKLKDFNSKYDYWKATAAEKRLIADEYDILALQLRGVRKNMFTGTLDRISSLSPRDKGGVYFNGAVASFIGAAMVLSFFNGVATRDKIDKIGDAVNSDKKR